MNKKDDDKWLNNLRERMEDYTEPLPDGLWNQLEDELAQPKIIPFWRRWPSVAAAVALVLVVSSLALSEWFTPLMDSPEMQEANRKVDALDEEDSVASNTVINEASSDIPQVLAEKSLDAVPPVRAAAASEKMSVTSAEENTFIAESIFSSRSEDSQTSAEEEILVATAVDAEEAVSKDSSSEIVERRAHYRSVGNPRMMADDGYQWSRRRRRADKGLEIGLHTGGMPYSSSKQFSGMTRFASRRSVPVNDLVVLGALNDKATAYNRVLFNNRDKHTKTDVKHRMPINVVASVKWHFRENWALETGISYTFLQSELHSGANLYWEDTQKLHYVGIPLRLHRNLWNNNRVSVYASAGGMIEKCVSGTMESVYVTSQSNKESETTDVEFHPFQWSVNAAVGAQVSLVRALSLFVEPGVAYYFDDNSQLETIRKEHPFNFNLQFGLRFDLQR